MVTINIARTTPLNPAGAHPILTPSQAWAGLLRKARRPQDFVPVVSSCEVLSETDTAIEAVVHFKPGVAHARRIKEVCRLRAPCRLDYEMEDGSSAVNVVSTTTGTGIGTGNGNGNGIGGEKGKEEWKGELMLTFVFEWVHPGVEEGSEEAREIERSHYEVSGKAIEGTIATMRKLALEGEL